MEKIKEKQGKMRQKVASAEGGFLGRDKRGNLGILHSGIKGNLPMGKRGQTKFVLRGIIPTIITILLLALIVAPISYLIIMQSDIT